MNSLRTREENIQRTKAVYQNPQLDCDIVMKGGITSGVVYPLALCELAKKYRFRSIGGASAGAIGAATAAAAEYGRTNGGTSFSEFEELPKWFGIIPEGSKNSNLYNLFQPQESTKKIFNFLISAILSEYSGIKKWFYIFVKGVKIYPFFAVIGILGALLLYLPIILSRDKTAIFGGIPILLVATFIGITAFVGYRIYTDLTKKIPENFYGMCKGKTDKETDDPRELTHWLSELIDRLAGVDGGDKPLTLGDLKSKDIDLLTITTNLTNGIPHTIPFNPNIYYFRPCNFKKLFPIRVVNWMKNNARDNSQARYKDKFEKEGLFPLPDLENLPVVFAARLSLSFPLLLSTVPLYAIDFTLEKEEKRIPEPCWFSDGGICSNFPIHFFDKPIPSRPTFAINLKEFHPDHPKSDKESENIWMRETDKIDDTLTLASWHRFNQTKGNKIFSFIDAIKNAMMNWRDTMQMSVPGYRDRIVHVSVSDEEGGLNLNMPPHIIDSLGKRGEAAGKKLADVYSNTNPEPGKVSWDNHRWIRFRSTLPLIVENLKNLYSRFDDNKAAIESVFKTYQQLINNPPSYDWNSTEQKMYADQVKDKLVTLANELTDDLTLYPNKDLTVNAPIPTPEYRIMPKI